MTQRRSSAYPASFVEVGEGRTDGMDAGDSTAPPSGVGTPRQVPTGFADAPVRPPVRPMLATLARDLPSGEWCYEPKWDGFRCMAFRSGPETMLLSRNQRPLARYFPEVVEALAGVGGDNSVVLDGEIVVAADSGVDFAALMLRLHPSASRVARLRSETPAAFIAFDVLAHGDRDLRSAPFGERRAVLTTMLAGSRSPVVLTPITAKRTKAELWLARFTGGGIDGVVAKDPTSPYEPGRRTTSWVKVKRQRTADCVVGGFRLVDDGRDAEVASLLLGAYDDAEQLRHVGVTSSFPVARRRQLLDDVRPFVVSLTGHPWERGFALERGPMGRLKGAAGSWDPASMAQDWVPLRPELVCEVEYDQVDATGRWRHPARFLRWRPDRDARSCGTEQLTTAPSGLGPLNDLLRAR